jgi:outer membrane receptor for ferrienterochelin and colicins
MKFLTLILLIILSSMADAQVHVHQGKSETITDTLKNSSVRKTNDQQLDEVVVSGTMKEVSKLNSPVPVEVYTAKYFRANPTPSIFESLQNINGVRPQLNCNICSTGDIHINGLEGPYTMILIDGMPIVSGLSTVYGLSGIPQSIIDRVEIVKGPASSLYGSEAVGGLINIITKKPEDAPLISADVFSTSWREINTDVSAKMSR